MVESGRADSPGRHHLARTLRRPRTGSDRSPKIPAGGRGGGKPLRRHRARPPRRLDDAAYQPAAVSDADGVRRRQHGGRKVRLPGRRSLHCGSGPAAGDPVEAQDRLGRRQCHADQFRRGAASLGDGRPEQQRLPHRLGGSHDGGVNSRRLQSGCGAASPPRSSRSHVADRAHAAGSVGEARRAAADQRAVYGPVAIGQRNRFRRQPPLLRRRRRPAEGNRRTPLSLHRQSHRGAEAR